MRRTYLKDLIVISLSAAVFLAASWTGFYGGDDWEYSEAANKWLSDGFFLGKTHWELRHPHVLPIAASYALFGFGEVQLLLSTVIYFILLLAVCYFFLNQFISRKAALLTCLLLAGTPILIFITTPTRPDTVEAFFVLLSVFMFWRAAQSGAPRRNLLLAGIAAGMSWLARETTISLLAVYGLLFLAGYRYTRWNYWIMAAGFISVLALEWAYLMALSGDPLYRYTTAIASHGAGLVRNTGESSLLGAGEAASSVAGNVSVYWVIDPFLAILFNQEFGLAFWIAIPAAIWLCFSNNVEPRHRDMARFLSLLAIIWFVLVSYGLGLREQPRYYTIPAIMAVMLIGIGFAQYGHAVSRTWRIMLMGVLIAVNLLCFYVDNENPLYEERAAIRLAKEMNEPIYTNANSALKASRLLKIKQMTAIVSDAVPPDGAIYLYVPCKEEDVPCNVLKRPEKTPEFDPSKQKAEWKQIWRDDPGRKLSGIVIEKLGLKRFVPKSIYYKLDYPSLPVTAYRVQGQAAITPGASKKNN